MTDYKLAPVKRCAACGNEKPVNEMKTCMHNQMHRYVCDSKCMSDFYNPPNNPRPDAVAPAMQVEPVALPPFATKIIEKLRRFDVCAEDGQDVDIGRHWLDTLVQLGLLNRVQRSPALWEMAQQGEDVLEGYTALQSVEQRPLLAKYQPCGCVICNCEHETQCQGCGAKYCGTHQPTPAVQGAPVSLRQRLFNGWKGCSNHGCVVVDPKPGMMRTNGTCQCVVNASRSQLYMLQGSIQSVLSTTLNPAEQHPAPDVAGLVGKMRMLVAAGNRLNAEAQECTYDDGAAEVASVDFWGEFRDALESAAEALAAHRKGGE